MLSCKNPCGTINVANESHIHMRYRVICHKKLALDAGTGLGHAMSTLQCLQ